MSESEADMCVVAGMSCNNKSATVACQKRQELEAEIKILESDREHNARRIIEVSKDNCRLLNENEKLRKRGAASLTYGEIRRLSSSISVDKAICDLTNDFVIMADKTAFDDMPSSMTYRAVLAVVLAREVNRLRHVRDMQSKENQELHERVTHRSYTISDLAAKLDVSNKEIKMKNALTKDQADFIARCQEDLRSADNERSDSRREIGDLQNQLASARLFAEVSDSEVRRLQKENKTLSDQLHAATTGLMSTADRKRASERLSIIREMAEQLKEVSARNDAANADVSVARSRQSIALCQLNTLSARFSEKASSSGGE